MLSLELLLRCLEFELLKVKKKNIKTIALKKDPAIHHFKFN